MRTGRSQRVSKDMDSRKEIVEIKTEISKLRNEVNEVSDMTQKEMTKSADKIRLDMCSFIENIKTLMEKLAEKMKKLETVVAVVKQEQGRNINNNW